MSDRQQHPTWSAFEVAVVPHEIRMAWDHFQTIGLLRHHEAWDDWELTLPPSPWETRPDDQLAGMDRF